MFAVEKRLHRAVRLIIDLLNVILGLGTVILAVMTFLNVEKNMGMFPIIFLAGGLMNLLTGIKRFMTDDKAPAIVMVIVALALFGISVASYLAVGGI